MTEQTIIPALAERDRIIDTKQSAALLGFSLAHYRRLYRAGKVPSPIKIGDRKLGNRLGTMLDYIVAKDTQNAA